MSNYDSYLDSSLEYLKQYIKDMKSRPILFIGSGFSQRYIYSPTWRGLLKQLIDENPEIDMPIEFFIQEHNGDYANIASELVDYYRNYAWKNRANEEQFPAFLFKAKSRSIHLKYKITSVLIRLMDQFEADTHELHEEIDLIKKLNPQAIITTNYDNLLEKLFPKYEAIVGQQVIHQKKSTDIGHILKIHGSVEDCNSIVIEQQDYDNFFKKQIYLIAKLFTYFMEHPIIFIGYSLSDENIKSILYNVKQIIDSEAEPMIENMWFIDWSREPINPDATMQKEKSIPVGNGESVRVNYIKLHTYEKLYDALYQDSVDIEFLKQIEETVYNVVKSDTITNLEVDIASLKYLTDRDNFLNYFTTSEGNVVEGARSMLTFAHISDANQLASQFCFTASQLSQKVFDKPISYWSYAYALIEDVRIKTGVDLRASNNKYHVFMNGVSRFSIEMVNLLKKVKDMEPYTININNQEIAYPIEGK
ncbi:SIR2 family protein [uncultured Brevibacillus sp.]|uniref:SIR2 family protein n=1 Tax=uncultured Brevibacillus sp. TaxID=169970 RepID=UPI0025995D40|nr:SIR2 family protein [uncultured Brevibacillus sp.]